MQFSSGKLLLHFNIPSSLHDSTLLTSHPPVRTLFFSLFRNHSATVRWRSVSNEQMLLADRQWLKSTYNRFESDEEFGRSVVVTVVGAVQTADGTRNSSKKTICCRISIVAVLLVVLVLLAGVFVFLLPELLVNYDFWRIL